MAVNSEKLRNTRLALLVSNNIRQFSRCLKRILFSKYNHEAALDRKPVNSGTNSEVIFFFFSEGKLEAELMNVECQPHLSVS